MGQFILRYRKDEELRWISHLDLKRTLERAMRRARLPLALTQGHNPHPRLSFGPPLPLGATSDAELITIHLSEALEAGQLKDRLNQQLPPGLQMLEAWSLPVYRKKETFGDIELAEYVVSLRGNLEPEDLQRRVDQLLASSALVVQRGGERPERTVDLRPLIHRLQVRGEDRESLELLMSLRTGSHGGARPQEVVALLGLDSETQVSRYHRRALSALPGPAGKPGLAQGRKWRRQTRKGSETRP